MRLCITSIVLSVTLYVWSIIGTYSSYDDHVRLLAPASGSGCAVHFQKRPPAVHRACIVPAAGKPALEAIASHWGASDADHTVVILVDEQLVENSSQPNLPRPVPKEALDVAVWRMAQSVPMEGRNDCVDGDLCFRSIAAAVLGIAAALSSGATTIMFVSGADPSGLNAAGVVLPTSNASRVPLVPTDQLADARTVGRTLLPDIRCSGNLSQPAPTPAPPDAKDVPMCACPPRDLPWTGGYSQEAGWGDSVAEVVGRHFVTSRRVALDGLTLCSVPVIAAIQYGLCQPESGSSLGDDWSAFLSSPLDDQATPLILPVGVSPPLSISGSGAGGTPVRVTYGGMAVHSTLAWALLPVVEPRVSPGVMALFQSVLAIYGHAAVVLPPGRLCGRSSLHAPTGTATPRTINARNLTRVVGSLAGSLRRGGTVSDLLTAALSSEKVLDAAHLSEFDQRALTTWVAALSDIAFVFPVVRTPSSAREALEPILRRWMQSGAPAASAANTTVASFDAVPPAPSDPLSSTALVYLFSLVDHLSREPTRRFSVADRYVFSATDLCELHTDHESRVINSLLPGPLGVPVPVDALSFRHLRHCFSDGAHVRDIVLVIV